jgi:ABC-type Fe3+-citrate transport system substrate-binding protein
LVTKALKDGLLQEIHQATGTMSTLELQDLSSSIDDFIVIVDSIVYDEVEQEHNMPVPTVMLKPTIQAIDHLVCDTSTISTTVAKTLEKTKRLQEDQAKKILYQELLKNWRPTRTQGN